MYGEKLIIFIELIYPSFKGDEAWNTAVNTCRDINKNMKVVNFPLIFAWRQWVKGLNRKSVIVWICALESLSTDN